MKHLRSPNAWSCLPTSFAMCLDLPVAELVKLVGHDGSDVWWPDLVEPNRRRGFHVQEMVVASWSLRRSVTPFEALPLSRGRGDAAPIPVQFRDSPSARMLAIMSSCIGVITGETITGRAHAVAWNGRDCLDPNGQVYGWECFRLQSFWAIKSM